MKLKLVLLLFTGTVNSMYNVPIGEVQLKTVTTETNITKITIPQNITTNNSIILVLQELIWTVIRKLPKFNQSRRKRQLNRKQYNNNRWEQFIKEHCNETIDTFKELVGDEKEECIEILVLLTEKPRLEHILPELADLIKTELQTFSGDLVNLIRTAFNYSETDIQKTKTRIFKDLTYNLVRVEDTNTTTTSNSSNRKKRQNNTRTNTLPAQTNHTRTRQNLSSINLDINKPNVKATIGDAIVVSANNTDLFYLQKSLG